MTTEATVKERPILFTPENVRKILAGTKTQTRRLITLPRWAQDYSEDEEFVIEDGLPYAIAKRTGCQAAIECPYGEPGDRLWVREAFTYWEDPGGDWKPSRKEPRFEYLSAKRQAAICERAANAGHDYLVYKADGVKRSLAEWTHPHQIYEHCIGKFDKTISPIHMPKWACRLWLELTDVRVERVQDISSRDITAEGVPDCRDIDILTDPERGHAAHLAAWRALWVSINGEQSWDRNDWVWVISFKLLCFGGKDHGDQEATAS